MKRKVDDVAMWARVPRSQIAKIERSGIRYGWRVAVMREVVAHLAATLKPGTRPSMDGVLRHARKAASQYARGRRSL